MHKYISTKNFVLITPELKIFTPYRMQAVYTFAFAVLADLNMANYINFCL